MLKEKDCDIGFDVPFDMMIWISTKQYIKMSVKYHIVYEVSIKIFIYGYEPYATFRCTSHNVLWYNLMH